MVGQRVFTNSFDPKINVNREYENLCYMAERMLDSIIKDSPNEQNIIFNVSFFIGGNAKIYKVESRPGSGHNVHAAIDSMYSYKKKNPEVSIEKYLSKALDWNIPPASKNFEILSTILQCLEYILYQEKNGNATFKIDIEKHLRHLKKEIFKNRKKLKQTNANIDNWLVEKNEFFKSKYRISIM